MSDSDRVMKSRASVRGGTRFHLEDPYMLRGGWHEPTICPSCNCVYYRKKWTTDKKTLEEAMRNPAKKFAKCPGCRKIEDHFVMGMVYIEGDFFATHRKDVLDAVKGEEKHAIQKNPLERIITITEGKDNAIIETTSDQLALRIGRQLRSTYQGKTEFKFSGDQKLVRIFWRR